MDEYPPKLYLLNTATETSSRDFLLVEQEGATAVIDGWVITAEKYIDMAGRIPEQNDFKEMLHIGAAPAVYVKAKNQRTGEQADGWVSCGSFIFEPSYLFVTNQLAVAMPRREAKRYLSRVDVLGEKGEREKFNIEVNHPARVGSWYIYQVGYDTARGRWSTTSVLECVRDRWYSAIHIALWTMLAAGVVMFATAGGRKRRKEDKQ